MHRELEPALRLARELPLEELPQLCADLEQVRVTCLARIAAPVDTRPDESLTIQEASKRLGVSRSWLYHHWRKYEHKFVRQEGGKVLFSSNGIDAHLRGKSK
jgi:excisionase family DNA binding protein